MEYPLWHPYSNINKGYGESINMAEGEGCYLYDINGKKYMDASSGLWNVSLGYSNKKILESVKSQLDKLPYCSLFEHTNQTAVAAAQKILKISGEHYKKVFFTCSGSESVELSVKLMRKYWRLRNRKGKSTILTLKNSYHGTYYASLSASNLEEIFLKDYEPMVPDFYSVQAGICSECDTEKCDMRCMDGIESLIRNNYESIAGIIIEPILASYGVTIVDNRFLSALSKLCTMYEVLVTVDEIATGFYRTGPAFYHQMMPVEPDLFCISKGINSGYLPMGAVVINESIISVFSKSGDIIVHGSTQNGNLLSCAASIAAIDQYTELNIRKNVEELGSYLKNQLIVKLSGHENIKDIRGIGFMLEIELTKGQEKNQTMSVSIIQEIQTLLRYKGLIVYCSDSGLTLLPMLIIDKNQADFIVQTILEVFSNLVI